MTAAARAANEYVVQRLDDTPFVPFFAVGDGLRPAPAMVARAPCITSDACTGSDTTDPASGTWMQGLVFRYPFSPFWQKLHITCLEYIGQKIGRLAMVPYLRGDPVVLMAGDGELGHFV
ncbi:hypothetical protein AB1Y20_023586 [Prymnesium parvum]|uniref:Uncharacterized protein n=1 Tax=Prymnesium parvum TaxID=97485 RepID=A0AB34JEZ6_PRYPA